MANVIKPHRGTSTYMISGAGKDLVLAEGELFVELPDSGSSVGAKFKIGDGVSLYSELPYTVGGGTEEVQIRNFSYTGAIQTFIAPETTEYTLEVWGGQGGSNSTTRGGYGGYSVGKIELEENDVLYICVGGAGTGGERSTPGFNGGGAANHAGSWERGSGGGATHIAKVNGLLNTLSSNLSDILIIAGGGGGGGCFTYTECGDGGDAGGYIATDGKQVDSSLIADVGHGGTQLAGGLGGSNNGDDGTFGQGANRTSDDNYGGSGGGGGLYGGGASCNTSGAGGGSSYISPDLTQACMYGYNVQESTDLETRTVSVLAYSALPTSEYAKAENGYARISWGGKAPIEYDDIKNKPQINGVTLSGDKSGADLGLVSTSETEGLLKNDGTVDTSKHVSLQPTTHIEEFQAKTWNGLTSFDGNYIWTDGDNIYYSNGTTHYVLDKSTSTWNTKTWNGLSSFYGNGVWTDGENIYYSYYDLWGGSGDSAQYVLDKSTSTWISKTWNGLTSFHGGFIWTDGTNIYYSYSSGSNYQYVLDKSTSTWSTKSWNGYSNINGYNVWTDGENIYYSYTDYSSGGSISNYVLDKSTSTWSAKTWNNQPSDFNGQNVWTDGENIYFSAGGIYNYVLDKSTSTWSEKTGLISGIYGFCIWTDGTNTYHSFGSSQYVFINERIYADGFVKSDGTIDTNEYVQTSATEGLLKNDGTVDTSKHVHLQPTGKILTGELQAKTWTGLSSFSGAFIWKDGDNIYYSSGNDQYVLDKSTNTWSTKTWNGLSSFTGTNVWTDGTNIYYSAGDSAQYVLDKSTSTWNTKTWNGLSSFDGQYIWTDGDNIYYSYDGSNYVLDKSTSTWSTKSWNGLSSFDGSCVWTDGENIYYSYNGSQYVLDKSTSTWNTKTWNGLSLIHGIQIWTDGTNIYYSLDSSQYVLDKSTSTWNTKSWTGYSSFYGEDVWTDGENIYYSYQWSNPQAQYVFISETVYADGFVKTDGTIDTNTYALASNCIQKSATEGLLKNDGTVDTSKHVHLQPTGSRLTGELQVKTWNGLNGFPGQYIWTDGENIYLSDGSANFVLDKSTSTWSEKTWYGYNSISGTNIWTDGDNIYYSAGDSDQYVLDKSTSTWSWKTWTGLSSFDGSYIWTDGTNIYFSKGSNQYVLDKSTSTWSTKSWNGLSSFDGNSVWKDGDNIYYSSGNDQYVLDKSTSTWSTKTWNGLTNINADGIWTDGDNIYYSLWDAQYVLDKSTSTWNTKTWTGFTIFIGNAIWTDGDNIYYNNIDQYVFVSEKIYADGFVKSDGTIDTNTYLTSVPTATSSALGLVKPDGSTITVDANGTISANADTSNCIQKSATEGLVKNDGAIDTSKHVHLQPTGYELTGELQAKTWSGLTSFYGNYVWTDGDNIYYSYNSGNQYVLDKSTNTWISKTWTGLTSFSGSSVWTDGDNIYYSNGNSSNQYVLDKSTSTWSSKTWNGYNFIYGYYIWTDGDNIYYSNNTYQYVLDKSTSTWNTKTWNGLTKFSGGNIWTDGTNIYYSDGSSTQYVLDKSTSTWSSKTWNGFTSFYGNYIWTDGDNIYYSNTSSDYHYVLDKSTDTWSKKTWNGLTEFNGSQVWTDGNNIYYSSSNTQYVFVSEEVYADGFVKSDGTIDTNEYAKKSEVAFITKTRYTITATNWSNSVDANGYYTYTVTLSPTLALSYPPNIYIAGAGDSTFPTDTEKEQYALLEQCNHTATNSLTLYAKTKPDTTFYVYIEGQVG